MKKIFSSREFVPDNTSIRILQIVSAEPSRRISTIVTKLHPEYGENDIRSRVRQLIIRRYLDEGISNTEIILKITDEGSRLLQKSSFQ